MSFVLSLSADNSAFTILFVCLFVQFCFKSSAIIDKMLKPLFNSIYLLKKGESYWDSLS